MALNAEEQSKWGERLAYIQAAMSQLEDLMKTNKLDDAAVEESLKFMVDVVGGKLVPLVCAMLLILIKLSFNNYY